jgi:hypothetical protein
VPQGSFAFRCPLADSPGGTLQRNEPRSLASGRSEGTFCWSGLGARLAELRELVGLSLPTAGCRRRNPEQLNKIRYEKRTNSSNSPPSSSKSLLSEK